MALELPVIAALHKEYWFDNTPTLRQRCHIVILSQGGSSCESHPVRWPRCCLAGTVHLPAVAQPAAEPTAADLVAKNLAARGGSAALAALKSVRPGRQAGVPGGFELTYNEVRSGGAVRVDAALQGLALVQAYDGKGGGWRINPFEGRKDAEPMGDDEARSFADTAPIAGRAGFPPAAMAVP